MPPLVTISFYLQLATDPLVKQRSSLVKILPDCCLPVSQDLQMHPELPPTRYPIVVSEIGLRIKANSPVKIVVKSTTIWEYRQKYLIALDDMKYF